MNLYDLKDEEVVVKKADLDAIVSELRTLRESINNLVVTAKLDTLCSGEFVTGKALRKIFGWSASTFQRRLHNDENPLPMTKDGREYKMTREDFLKYYKENYKPKLFQNAN